MHKVLIIAYCYIFIVKNIAGELDMWNSYQFGSGAGNREELIVRSVTLDAKFNLGKYVTHWESLRANGKNYAVGLSSSGLTIILFNDANTIVTFTDIDIQDTVTDLTLLLQWNNNLGKNDIIIILAVNDMRLKWYRLNEQLHMEHFLDWTLHHNVVHLKAFRVFDKHLLLIINEKEGNYSTADIYEYLFHGDVLDFWLLQTIILENVAYSSALNIYALEAYLTIPQENINKLMIFKYSQNHFISYLNITNIKSSYVNSFNIGSKSFLTAGGENAGIFVFTRKGLDQQQIIDHDLNEIHYWFPLSIKTYKDDVVLLAQRNIDHSTHKSVALEVILYDGEKFVLHDEIPCSFNGEIEHGLACLTDEEMDQGIIGSAVIASGDVLRVLVPRKDAPSALFVLHTEMRQVESPINVQAKKLLNMRDDIKAMLNEQNKKLRIVEKRMANSLKANDHNVISAPWQINALSTTAMQVEESINWIPSNLDASHPLDINYQILMNKMSNASKKLQNIENAHMNFLGQQNVFAEEIILYGNLNVTGTAIITDIYTENINNESAKFLFDDIVRSDNVINIINNKTIKSLTTKNVTFTNLNNISSENIAYATENLTINGDITFVRQLHVTEDIYLFDNGKVNSFILPEEVIVVNRLYDTNISFSSLFIANSFNVETINNISSFEYFKQNISFKNALLLHNLTVKYVNDIDFMDFLHNIYFTNLNYKIPGRIILEGDLFMEKGGVVRNLNNIAFPEGYVINTNKSSTSDGQSFKLIKGKITFINGIEANEITAKEGIDELNNMGHVDFMNDQMDLGNYTFYDLEITESLEVNNETYGTYIDDFLPNPILTQTNDIKSNVVFKNLLVRGNILIKNLFNGSSLGTLVNNIVYKDENNVEINSIKYFPQGLKVENGLQIRSNTLNTISIKSFVTKDTEQQIFVNVLNGNMIFENLYVQGLYDDVNILELYQSCFRLTGQQFITSTLDFLNSSLVVNHLKVKEKLNGLMAEDILDIKNLVPLYNIYFESVNSPYVISNEQIYGNLININLLDIENRALCFKKEQVISGKFFIEKSELMNIEVELINGVHFNTTFNNFMKPHEIWSYIQNENCFLEDLHIAGSLVARLINNINLEKALPLLIKISDIRSFPKHITFTNTVSFDYLEITFLNNYNFNHFVKNIVFKNETDIIIYGEKYLTNGFIVKGSIYTNYLNGIPIEDFIGLYNICFKPVIIMGNLILKSNVKVDSFNGVNLESIISVFKTIDSTTYILKGDLWFERLAYIERLYVEGKTNDIDTEEYLRSIIYKNATNIILSTIQFTNRVKMDSNLQIFGGLNEIHLSNILSDIILITTDSDIEGVVTFESPILVENRLDVETYLDAVSLSGINIYDWKNNAIHFSKENISVQVIFASVEFNRNVNASVINGIDFNAFVPLKSNQIIPVNLYFEEINLKNNVSVAKNVNGLNLEEEYRNTIIGEIHQNVYSKIIFIENVVVENNIQVYGKLNYYDIDKIVNINQNQNLTANYVFNEISLNENLLNTGFVNNKNFDEWKRNVFTKNSKEIQKVTGDWSIKDITFAGDVNGPNTIANLTFSTTFNYVMQLVNANKNISNKLKENYIDVCQKVQNLLTECKKQTYVFKYFEFLPSLPDTNDDIQNVHFFNHGYDNYLLVNVYNDCNANLYRWSGNKFKFITNIHTGYAEQFINVKDAYGHSFLVSRSNADVNSVCSVIGTNIWMMEENLLVLLGNIIPADLLQDSAKPNTFYVLTKGIVMEYSIISNPDITFRINRRWEVHGDNLAFIPRGVRTGLALRDGTKIFKLFQENISTNEKEYFDELYSHNWEIIQNGNFTVEFNQYMPGASNGEMIVLSVQNKIGRKNLIAISSHENTSVKGPLDFIKIYENIQEGILFHKVPANNPSSLVAMDFRNGETLLIFIENNKFLKIYEYKGIEGFIPKISLRVDSTNILPLSLVVRESRSPKNLLVLINRNKISIVKAVMAGDPANIDYLNCIDV